MELDLHGLSVVEATSRVVSALFSFEEQDYEDELIIICGKGTGAIKISVIEILDEEDYYYEEINDGGAIRVGKY
ncbi:MAG: Smr/MutS family protein [Metamycoplasmataceae bacterium]